MGDTKQAILDYFTGNWARLFEACGCDLPQHKRSAQVLVRAPYRDDHNPSMSINLVDGLWDDKARDGFQGDGFTLWGLVHGFDAKADFPAILDGIADKFGISSGIGPRKIRSLRERGVSEKTAKAFEVEEQPGDNRLSLRIVFPVFLSDQQLLGYKTHHGPHLKPDGSVARKGEGVPAQLYPWKVLLQETVYIVNGEPSVWRAWEAGFRNVLCSTGGEGSFKKEWAIFFEGKTVCVVLDNDKAGLRGTEKICSVLSGVTPYLNVVVWPQHHKAKGDLEDWLNEDHRLEDLECVPWNAEKGAEAAPDDSSSHGETEQKKRHIDLIPRSAEDLIQNTPEVEWLVQDVLPVEATGVLVSEGGVGKSWMAMDLAIAVDQGRDWLGKFPVEQGKVLILDEENADRLLRDRLMKMQRAEGLPEDGSGINVNFLTSEGINLSNQDHVEAVDQLLDKARPNLVIVDALVRVHSGNENDAMEMAALFSHFKGWMNVYKCAFVFCHHRRKSGAMGNDPGNMFRGSSEIKAFVDTLFDLNKRGKDDQIIVTHAKSRYGEPIPSFEVEIVDTAANATTVRYVGEASESELKRDQARGFYFELTADGEVHTRQESLEKGKELGLGKAVLDEERKRMVKEDELEPVDRGKEVGFRRPGRFFRSDTPIGEEETSAGSDVELGQEDSPVSMENEDLREVEV